VSDTGDARPDPEEMQARLDEFGGEIDEARRQAEADDLLPDEHGKQKGEPVFEEAGMGLGDVDEETPTEGSGSA
jgi:hypothetical protein